MRPAGWGLAAIVALAGCVGGPADKALVDASPSSSPPIDLKTLPPSDEPRTLDAPPQWQSGEWWRIRLTDNFTKPQRSYEALRVVAGAEGDDYLVGMPAENFSNPMMVLHVPGFGQVDKANLSFEIHDARFQPVQFPLREGLEWKTAFEGRPLNATVLSAGGGRAEVELVGPNDHITLTYDAEMGEVIRFLAVGYGSYEVLDHGVGHAGLVTVPHMHDLIFQEARIGVVLSGGLQPTTTSTDTVQVDSTYDRVSFVILLGNILPFLLGPGAPDAPLGTYTEKARAPDGTTYELSMGPTEPGPLKAAFFRHEAPGGTWTFEHLAAGPGIALTEGIAYHVYDVELPSGRILPSTGEHAHGT